MKSLKPMRLAMVLFGITAFAGLIYMIVVPRSVSVEAAKVKRSDFREIIKSDGVLRSKHRYTVPAFADGDIKRVDLKVGDSVKKGQAVTALYWDVKYDPVKSPITGVVSKVYRESAGPIRRGEPILEVVDPAQLEVMAELLTSDAVRVKLGNPATIEGWGGELPLSCEVVGVSKAGFIKQSALGVEEEKTEVTMNLKDVSKNILARLGNTFHVDVSIEISKHENALVIPVGALFRDGPLWAVYKITDERAIKVNVVPTARSSGESMIESGVNEGDLVVAFPGDLVKDGARVRMDEALLDVK